MAASATAQELVNGDPGKQDLPSSDKEKSPKDVDPASEGSEKDAKDQDDVDWFETSSTVSKKIQNLRNNKKSGKTRLTKARNQLKELLESQQIDVALPSKNAIRRAVNKVKSESNVIEKIIGSLKEVYATSEEIEGTDTIIEALDKEVDEILTSADSIIDTADNHLQERLANGEEESDLLSFTKSYDQSSLVSKSSSYVKQKQLEAKEASERLLKMEQEQRQKEQELEKLTAELQLTKQRTEEARKVAALNQSRAEKAERASEPRDIVQNYHTSNPVVPNWEGIKGTNLHVSEIDGGQLTQKSLPIKLKGVDLPKFSGVDKADYEPWKAAFMSIVDRLAIPVNEKMLRLQSSLTGKALTLVKDLGYTLNAYERAKAKLEKKYGGERRLQIKHLTALRGWKKV